MPKIKPMRLQRKRTKGFHLESPNGLGIVYVGRPSRWGNPYKVGDIYYQTDMSWKYPKKMRVRNAQDAVYQYEKWIMEIMYTDPGRYKEMIVPLSGKNLSCFCPLDQPCHADVLLKLASQEVEDAEVSVRM